jgi:hypothetical protein
MVSLERDGLFPLSTAIKAEASFRTPKMAHPSGPLDDTCNRPTYPVISQHRFRACRSGLMARRPWPEATTLMAACPIVRFVPALACLLAAALAIGDEPQDEKTRAALSSEHGIKEVRSFSIRSAGPGGQEFHLVPKPVLKWSNPVVGSVHGEVYVWTLKGRPEVVSSFLEWFQPIQSQEVELHSLSLGPLVADRPDHLSWTSNQPGVELKPIPDAPAPAATPAQRLRQIRELAKDFTARQLAASGVDYEMRLLLQPIYRYERTEGDLIDGALFAIVHATDPEVFLQIEARKVGGATQWQYSLARFNSNLMTVSHKGREIWTAPQIIPYTRVLDRVGPYTNIIVGPSPP